MKFLFCDNNLSMLLNFRGDVIDYFISQGNEVVLVYPNQSATAAVLDKVPKQCKCYGVNVEPSAINPLKDISFLFQLRRIYAHEKPDMVFHYTIKPNIYGSLVASALKIKTVAMVAGLGYVFAGKSVKQNIGRLLYKYGLQKTDKVIVLNENNYNVLKNTHFVKSDKLILFKSGEGVNLEKFRNGR